MEPAHDAWDLLQRMWMKGPTIVPLPVDPWAISRKLGIEVYRNDEMAAELTGILRKPSGSHDPKIYLNADDAHERRRFVCARALGHYNRNIELRRDEVWEIVDGRDVFGTPIGDAEQSYATEFAAELLMPRAVLNELGTESTVDGLARLFGVTDDVMAFRLEQIGWITP